MNNNMKLAIKNRIENGTFNKCKSILNYVNNLDKPFGVFSNNATEVYTAIYKLTMDNIRNFEYDKYHKANVTILDLQLYLLYRSEMYRYVDCDETEDVTSWEFNIDKCIKPFGSTTNFLMVFLEFWNNPKNETVVITHDSCNDGHGVAEVIKNYNKNNNLKEPQVIYLGHGRYDIDDVLEQIKDKVVYIGDFSFSPDNYNRIIEVVKKVVTVDHHQTAMDNLSDYSTVYIDTTISGSVLAYHFFNPSPYTPYVLELLNDRDMYNHFYGDYTDAFMYKVLKEGPSCIQDYLIKDIQLHKDLEDSEYILKVKEVLKENTKWARKTLPYTINGIDVSVINITQPVSDILNIASKLTGKPAISWNFVNTTNDADAETTKYQDCINFGFRNYKDNISVELMAKLLGGGGHRQASGALVNVRSMMLKTFFMQREILIKYKISDKDRVKMKSLFDKYKSDKGIDTTSTKKEINITHNLYTNKDVHEYISFYGLSLDSVFEITRDKNNIVCLKVK